MIVQFVFLHVQVHPSQIRSTIIASSFISQSNRCSVSRSASNTTNFQEYKNDKSLPLSPF